MDCPWAPRPADVGFALICAVFAAYWAWRAYLRHRYPIKHRDEDLDG